MSLRSMLFGASNELENIQNERDKYKEKSERLSQEVYDLQAIITKEIDSNKRTSFVDGKIQKIQELENELAVQKQRVHEVKEIAQEANSVKQDFLVNMRHEVRTPMNSIIAFSDMLSHELVNKTQLSYAKNIFSSGHKLLALMDNIIELSRLESGMFEVNNKAIDTHLLYNTLITEHEVKAYNKGILLTLDIEKEIPSSLMLDDNKVKSILDNLIDNAIKFTKQGMVNVKVVVEKYNYTQNRIDIAMVVADTGKGIDAINHQKIFEIFEKKESSSEHDVKGTGLGLSINKKMAKLMHGDISVSSKVGEGSVFTFKLNGLEVILASAEDTIDELNINFGLVKPEGANIMSSDTL